MRNHLPGLRLKFRSDWGGKEGARQGGHTGQPNVKLSVAEAQGKQSDKLSTSQQDCSLVPVQRQHSGTSAILWQQYITNRWVTRQSCCG